MTIIRTHDALFRFVFGEPEQLAELLRAHLPAAIADAIDWKTLRRVDGSFVDAALQGRHADMLFEADMGDVRVLLYLLSEYKSRDERLAAWQVARYVGRIIDRWLRENHVAQGLPAVLPVLIYHGSRPWRSPRSPHRLVDLRGCGQGVARWLRRHQMRLPFVLLDLSRVTEEQIDAMRLSIVSAMTLRFVKFLRQCPPAAAAAHILRWQWLIERLLGHPRGKEVLLALVSWWLARSPANHDTLRTVMTKIDEENRPMRSMLDLVLELGEQRGEQRGERRGMVSGARSLIERLVQKRFGALSEAYRQRLDAADEATLQALGERLLVAASLEELFAGG